MAFLMQPLQYEVPMLWLLVCIILLVYFRFFYVDFGEIKGLQEVPGNSLISEDLYMLGNDHVSTAVTWALANSWPVYQIKPGNRSAIMPNSFDVLGNGLSAGKRRLSIAHGCTRSM
jgi:hypothetical protein